MGALPFEKQKTLEDFTIESAARSFIDYQVPSDASCAQRYDMSMSFMTGAWVVMSFITRLEKETQERASLNLTRIDAELKAWARLHGRTPS